MRTWRITGYVACFAVGIAASGWSTASPLFGPKGAFSSLFHRIEYDPSEACTKPYRPYGSDRYAWESYKADATRYLDCMKDAADADAKYAVEVVYDGYEKAADDFLQEVKRGY